MSWKDHLEVIGKVFMVGTAMVAFAILASLAIMWFIVDFWSICRG